MADPEMDAWRPFPAQLRKLTAGALRVAVLVMATAAGGIVGVMSLDAERLYLNGFKAPGSMDYQPRRHSDVDGAVRGLFEGIWSLTSGAVLGFALGLPVAIRLRHRSEGTRRAYRVFVLATIPPVLVWCYFVLAAWFDIPGMRL